MPRNPAGHISRAPGFLTDAAVAGACVMAQFLFDEPDKGPAPPGTGPTIKYEGPWFRTQLFISTSIGLIAFVLFSYCRTRWQVLFSPRTKLKGFSPHNGHAHEGSTGGWIMPTIRISELAVLQIVGLDAAVLLNFYKMSFQLFTACAAFASIVLMPLNYYMGRSIGGDEPEEDPEWPSGFARDDKNKNGGLDWFDLVSESNAYLFVQLLYTYVFTFFAMRFVHKNYRRFVRARQLFSLELVHSIAARTVLVTSLPSHLRGERALADYFERMGLSVESVSLCREIGSLKTLLDKRTNTLLALEQAWTAYVGNPCAAEAHDPSVAVLDHDHDAEAQLPRRAPLVVPHRPRPTIRPDVLKPPVDAIEYLEAQFKDLDEQVRKRRRSGKFKATQAGFVTFETMASAQIASQIVHSPFHAQTKTFLAPEPRDVIWANMGLSERQIRIRELFVMIFLVLMFFFWIFPIASLASLLSYKEIKKTMPWLAAWIDKSENLRAIVQNSLPSVAMITLNGVLPFIFEGLAYLEGFRARSWIEYSVMKKYFLFLLVNVVFIFLLASTYWQLVRDLANSPAKIPEKLAVALTKGTARHFFLSYVILQAIGIMPLQLLNLGVIIPRFIYLAFITRSPRDFAELNAPPMVNYGQVYPQSILIFVITILYSVIQPLILYFGALYFGIAYVVYKYKLLYIFYKPYESQGQAWPITFVRLMWGVVIFQVLMTGIFTLKQSWYLSVLMVPLLGFTVYWTWTTDAEFRKLSRFVSLSSVCEVQRGEEADDVVRLRGAHPVSWSQSNLNRRRYAQNDETLYLAPEDDRTDYSQPPMTNWYNGVLNTGKRRYGHPALTGILPQPWLPLKPGQSLANRVERGAPGEELGMGMGPVARIKRAEGAHPHDNAVVLTMRRRVSSVRSRGDLRALRSMDNGAPAAGATQSTTSLTGNPWNENGQGQPTQPRRLQHRLSFDHATGVIMLPEDSSDSSEDEDAYDGRVTPGSSSEGGEASAATPTTPTTGVPPTKRHGTYYHHPERRRSMAFGTQGPSGNGAGGVPASARTQSMIV